MHKEIGILYLLLATLLPITVFSQKIEMDMPSCYALQYTFALSKGTRKDTITSGRLDTEGKASFVLPDKYKTYRGVGTLSIGHCKENINIILNGEGKIVLYESDDSRGWGFRVSDENIYLLNALARLGNIIGECNNIIYNQKSGLIGNEQYHKQFRAKNGEYKLFREEIEKSHLYAARIMEILFCLSRVGNELDQTAQQINDAQKEFISEKLSFKDLYSSSFWEMVMELWCHGFLTEDTLLLSNTRELLDKTEDIIIRRYLTQSIIQLFSKYGKDHLLMDLGSEYLTIPVKGSPAPELVTDGMPIQPRHCLIFFYDSECGSCHYEMRQLMEQYYFLNNSHNQIDIISIAADTNRDMFEETASKFPWEVKLCDFKGFESDNFANYGIVGTPTFILVDKDGIIRGRYAKLNEFMK